jgi:hypothetical protein
MEDVSVFETVMTLVPTGGMCDLNTHNNVSRNNVSPPFEFALLTELLTRGWDSVVRTGTLSDGRDGVDLVGQILWDQMRHDGTHCDASGAL